MGVSMRQSFKHSDHAVRGVIQQQVRDARSYRSRTATLGRSVSAISREVARNRCDAGCYEAISAGNAARVRRRRGLVKLREGSALREHVIVASASTCPLFVARDLSTRSASDPGHARDQNFAAGVCHAAFSSWLMSVPSRWYSPSRWGPQKIAIVPS